MKAKKGSKAQGKSAPKRWRCKLCNYIYSPLIGEPHNGIPAGTAFENLPDTYVCPVCGQAGKGKVGKWGFEEWVPTRFVCKACGYIYDKARGEPHHGIKPGTAFEDLPDEYVCPVCAIDPAIVRDLGKVGKEGFEPILL
jgi:rubredoxin